MTGAIHQHRALRALFGVMVALVLMVRLLAPSGFMPVMQHLLSGRDLHFPLSGMTGVVSFPSFHTAMALAYCWAFRKTGIISAAITTLNIIMLCAVPFFGGHYLVDMVAGAAAMLLALAIIKTAPLLTRKPIAANASQESAAASGGAY